MRLKNLPFYYLILITLSGTVRSLIHMFAPDGGVSSIAGITIAGDAGANIVAIFGQWGASQLILAIIGWAVIFRHRQLTSFMLGIQLLELVLRECVGIMKPLVVAAPPPGAYMTWILLPVTAIVWLLSLSAQMSAKLKKTAIESSDS